MSNISGLFTSETNNKFTCRYKIVAGLGLCMNVWWQQVIKI
jgi:hypothetical protein